MTLDSKVCPRDRSTRRKTCVRCIATTETVLYYSSEINKTSATIIQHLNSVYFRNQLNHKIPIKNVEDYRPIKSSRIIDDQNQPMALRKFNWFRTLTLLITSSNLSFVIDPYNSDDIDFLLFSWFISVFYVQILRTHYKVNLYRTLFNSALKYLNRI